MRRRTSSSTPLPHPALARAVVLGLVLALCGAVASEADAQTVFQITGTHSMDGYDGVLLHVTEPDEPDNDLFLVEEGDWVRIHAVRDDGDPWETFDEPLYLVKQRDLSVGDTWNFLPDWQYGPATLTVEAFEDVTVAAGTFPAVLVSERLAADPAHLLCWHWFVEGIGLVRSLGVDPLYETELHDYWVGGEGNLPLDVGNTWNFEEVTAAPETAAPRPVRLLGAEPNPFNPRTNIRFELAAPAAVTVELFDTAGRLVRTLASERTYPEGAQVLAWDGIDDAGRGVPSGVYLCRLRGGSVSETKSITLVR